METQVRDINLDDPFAAADSAQPRARAFYGQIELDIWFCALVKGVGKEPYDPAKHKSRNTAVTISVHPLPEQNISFEVKRELIAESREWAGIVWASLKALGIASTRDAHHQWVKMVQVPSGRTYRGKDGVEKESTTFKFEALYADEDACRAAYLSDTGQSDESDTPETAAPAAAAAAPADKTDQVKLRRAVPFIEAFAKKAEYELEATRAACKGQKIITEAVDLDSGEFAAIVANAAARAYAAG